MAQEMHGLLGIGLTMMAIGALVVFGVTVWLGLRRIGRGEVVRALWTTNALVLFNAWLGITAYLAEARFVDNPALWLIGGVGGPLLVGYALGTSLGLVRRRRSQN